VAEIKSVIAIMHKCSMLGMGMTGY